MKAKHKTTELLNAVASTWVQSWGTKRRKVGVWGVFPSPPG